MLIFNFRSLLFLTGFGLVAVQCAPSGMKRTEDGQIFAKTLTGITLGSPLAVKPASREGLYAVTGTFEGKSGEELVLKVLKDGETRDAAEKEVKALRSIGHLVDYGMLRDAKLGAGLVPVVVLKNTKKPEGGKHAGRGIGGTHWIKSTLEQTLTPEDKKAFDHVLTNIKLGDIQTKAGDYHEGIYHISEEYKGKGSLLLTVLSEADDQAYTQVKALRQATQLFVDSGKFKDTKLGPKEVPVIITYGGELGEPLDQTKAYKSGTLGFKMSMEQVVILKMCEEVANAAAKGVLHDDNEMENILVKTHGPDGAVGAVTLNGWGLPGIFAVDTKVATKSVVMAYCLRKWNPSTWRGDNSEPEGSL